ncbi:MAG: S-layer homology domain-containing protein, partial [Candidatus Peribacteraceae bacterium]|nr:S-layer homology domain-containing protein [Candidatus Peribacteraceae bacterium]
MPAFRLLALFVSATLVMPILSEAAGFPDVPRTYLYQTQIESLADLGVISGNPDGTFRPTDPVNRAAMLKMLYLMAKRTPAATAKGCFPDVQQGAWYESFVCDAAANGFVKGYVDGTFKPGRPVTHAEALKMSFAVLDIALQGDEDRSEWFLPYVDTARALGILPLSGRADEEFLPHEPIERGEA